MGAGCLVGSQKNYPFLSTFESGIASIGSVLMEELMNLNMSRVEEPDREQFVRLIMRHDRAIRAYLRSLLPASTDVDEVMQEVGVVAWRKFGELDDPNNFRRWVCVIARYEVLMHRRKKSSRPLRARCGGRATHR